MKINIKRLLADCVDFYLLCFVSTFVVVLVTFGKCDITAFSLLSYFFSLFILLLLKDKIFGNASLGKRIFKIKIINKNNNTLTNIECFKRTLTLILLPLEIFMILLYNKRIGDIWAKTSVVQIG